MSFTKKILLGLVIGVACGLFFGEIMAPLNAVGDIYIGLLQMTVLPYIVLSLLANLGRISWSQSRGLLLSAIAVFAVLLLIGTSVLFLTPLAFPPSEAASFFKPSLVAEPPLIDLVGLYVPSNPFAALAGNMVPAAVVFSIFLGVGLSTVPGKQGLLDGMDALADALNRVNKLVIKLTPLGVFAIAAATAGTISIEEIARLQGFLITYTLLVAVMTFLVLPLLVSSVTPFTVREFLGIPKDSLITIFAAGKIIVLMPQLIENVKEMFRRHELLDDETAGGAEIMMPLAYPFPNLGTYIILMFVVFAAWYLGRPLDVADQFTLQAMSLFSSFIAPIVGIPFLLDVMRLPADVMDLFILSTVYTDRIRVVLGAVHLLALTVVVLSIRRGVFQPNWRKLGGAVAISLVAIVGVLLGTRFYLATQAADEYHGDEDLVRIAWMEGTVEAVQYRDSDPAPDPAVVAAGRLEGIVSRGSLRVGYLPDSLPWAFSNEQGEVTGFDIEMAHNLARSLNVSLELVRISPEQINGMLDNGQIDILMSGLAQTPDRLREYRFAGSTGDLTAGFLVPDHRRKAFEDLGRFMSGPPQVVGVVQGDAAFERQLSFSLPNIEVRRIDSPRAFLRGEMPELDAVLYSAEGGSAWTLLYPDYTMVVPQPIVARLPLGYMVPRADDEWARFIDSWVSLKRKDTTVQLLFDHWIRGQGATIREPRWSVIRNVLGWVD